MIIGSRFLAGDDPNLYTVHVWRSMQRLENTVPLCFLGNIRLQNSLKPVQCRANVVHGTLAC
jgi:hypothetical protein